MSLARPTVWVIIATSFLNGLTLALIQSIIINSVVSETDHSLGGWDFVVIPFGKSTVTFGVATAMGLVAAWGLTCAPLAVQMKSIGAMWMVLAILLVSATHPFVLFAEQRQTWFSHVLSLGLSCAAIWLVAICHFIVPCWAASRSESRLPSPYFLLAVGFLGSLFAIFGYPLLIQSSFSPSAQLLSLKTLFIGVGIMTLLSGLPSAADQLPHQVEESTGLVVSTPTWLDYIKWVGLSALTAALVLGVTSQVNVDIAVIPLFWLVPLGLYETSLVVAFSRVGPARPGFMSWVVQGSAILAWAMLLHLQFDFLHEIARTSDSTVDDILHTGIFLGSLLALLLIPYRWTLAIQLGLAGLVLTWSSLEGGMHPMSRIPVWDQIWLWLGACAVTWWGCHGELVQTRPHDRFFLRFIACMALGVTLGNVFMLVIAPAIWVGLSEFKLVLGAAVVVRVGIAYGKRWSAEAVPNQ